mgnify:FL=1
MSIKEKPVCFFLFNIMFTAEPDIIVVSPKGDVAVGALSSRAIAEEGSAASSEWNVVEDPTERMSQTIKDMQSEISKMKKKARKDSKAHKEAMKTLAQRVENTEDTVDYLSAALESKMSAVGDILKFYMDDQIKLGSAMVDHLRVVENDIALASIRAERFEEDITEIQQITLRVLEDISALKIDAQKSETEGFYWDEGDMHSKYSGIATDTLEGFVENETPQESDGGNYGDQSDTCGNNKYATRYIPALPSLGGALDATLSNIWATTNNIGANTRDEYMWSE